VARAIIRELDQGAPASQEMVARLMASVLARPDVAAVLSLPGVPSEHLPARLIEAADLVLRCAASTSQSADSAAAGTRAAPAHP
jgi:hypothetical protein